MSNLMALSDTAINYVMNLFRWVGRSAGVLAGEIAMTVESGFNWERLKSGLAGAVEYTDMLGEANTKATAAIAAAGNAIEFKAGVIAAGNLEEKKAADAAADHARQQKAAALAAKMAALSAGQNTGAMKGMAEAAKGAGGAAKGTAKGVDEQTRAMDALIKKYLPARSNAEELAEGTLVLNRALAAGKISAEEYATALAGLTRDLDTTLAVLDKYDRAGAAERDQGCLAGRGAASRKLGPEESRHAGLGHIENHAGRIAGLHPETRAHLGQHRLFGGGGVQGG